MNGWISTDSEEDAADKASLRVTVLGENSRTESFGVSRAQYAEVVRMCYRGGLCLPSVPGHRPVELSLTLLDDDDPGPGQVTVDLVLECCRSHMGQALEDTAKDRKRLSQRISDAATKRAGYDLPGRGGH